MSTATLRELRPNQLHQLPVPKTKSTQSEEAGDGGEQEPEQRNSALHMALMEGAPFVFQPPAVDWLELNQHAHASQTDPVLVKAGQEWQ